MSPGTILTMTLLALTCQTAVPPPSVQEAGARELSQYEKGEESNLRELYGRMSDDEAAEKSRVREFLWERWRARKLAYITISVGYTHGDSGATNYYVEPDGAGRWRIAVESVSNCCALDVLAAAQRGEWKEFERKTRVVGGYYVVWRTDAESGRPVPDEERRKPETYTLLLQERARGRDEIGLTNTHRL